MLEKIPVGILGATGMVGQRFIQLLENHPWFEIKELAASERSAGKSYEDAVSGRWKVSADIPNSVKDMKVKLCKPGLNCKLVFSALDSSVAGPIEEEFAEAGYVVASNAKNHRMDADAPLIIPEVNPEHLEMVKQQKRKGFIVTNPNCSTIGLVLALAPLHMKFGLEKVCVTTMQAISGAGYPGVASLDIIDNVIPFIGGEEGKMESEPLKILGSIKNNRVVNADIRISAQCNRVHTKDGHLETVNISLNKKASLNEVKECLRKFNPLKELKLPTAPNPPIILREEDDRPQPRLDRDEGRGMAAVVGRIRECQILDYRMIILSHNTIRGAAGASVLNAELMKAKGFI